MPPPIKEPRRLRYLVIRDIITALGGYREVAKIVLVAPVTVSKWMEDERGSGQDIPVKHLRSLLAEAGARLGNLPLQNGVDELLQEHFLALCYRRAYLEDRVVQFIEMLQGQGARMSREG